MTEALDDKITLAVIAAEMKHLNKTVDELAADVRQDRSTYVTRYEWDQRTAHVDAEISAVKADIASKRAPWWSVGALLVAAAALLFVILQAVP